jgi:hypothetical protein
MTGPREQFNFNLRGRNIPRRDPFPGQRPATRDLSTFTAPIARVRFEELETGRSRSLSPTRKKLEFERGVADETEPSFLQSGTPIGGDADLQCWTDTNPYRARAAAMYAPPPTAPEPAIANDQRWSPSPPGYLTSMWGGEAGNDRQTTCKQEQVTPGEQKPYAALWKQLHDMEGTLKKLSPPVAPKPASHIRSRSETRASETGGDRPHPLVPARTSSITNSDVTSRGLAQLAVSDNIMAPEPFFGQKDEDGEFFVDSFEDYASYKRLTGCDKRRVFGRFMKAKSRKWYQTLSAAQLTSYDSILNAFKERYFRAPEVKFVETASLFSEPQKLT